MGGKDVEAVKPTNTDIEVATQVVTHLVRKNLHAHFSISNGEIVDVLLKTYGPERIREWESLRETDIQNVRFTDTLRKIAERRCRWTPVAISTCPGPALR